MCTGYNQQGKFNKENTSNDDTTYPVSVYENEWDKQGHVKVHYIGYGCQYDEWREPEGLVHLDSPCVVSEKYDFHQELALQIKSALIASHKSNPSVKIVMPFDKASFLWRISIPRLCIQVNKPSYVV